MNIPKNIRAFLKEKANIRASGEYASFICEVEEQLEILEENETPMISPVEQMFFIEWEFLRFGKESDCPEEHFDLRPQYKNTNTGKYRIDFVVNFFTAVINCPSDSIYHRHEEEIASAVPEPLLGIEIDGHEWHEKTKNQAQHDKERERFLVAQGWKILRFTGAEVFNHTDKCVGEVADCARSLAVDYHKRIRSFLSQSAGRK